MRIVTGGAGDTTLLIQGDAPGRTSGSANVGGEFLDGHLHSRTDLPCGDVPLRFVRGSDIEMGLPRGVAFRQGVAVAAYLGGVVVKGVGGTPLKRSLPSLDAGMAPGAGVRLQAGVVDLVVDVEGPVVLLNVALEAVGQVMGIHLAAEEMRAVGRGALFAFALFQYGMTSQAGQDSLAPWKSGSHPRSDRITRHHAHGVDLTRCQSPVMTGSTELGDVAAPAKGRVLSLRGQVARPAQGRVCVRALRVLGRPRGRFPKGSGSGKQDRHCSENAEDVIRLERAHASHSLWFVS